MSAEKNVIRRNLSLRRDGMLSNQVIDLSQQVSRKLVENQLFGQASVIFFYAAINNEVNLSYAVEKALQAGKRVVFPRVVNDCLRLYSVFNSKNDLEPGYAKILEPKTSLPEIQLSELDLILVPGIAFDKNGNRVGYGKGHFDRFLEHLTKTKIGIAYDFQVVDFIPAESHDIIMDYILTERGMITCQ
ncbi:MAG TPA: 5-formyltetrahydrofolate cyclo-ligase [Candidatus Nanoarchaeia archaeon]|nr:5-formyltetrahydrofolate cyclo-ligase [Candidatus Nanoarchaeia archaeon]